MAVEVVVYLSSGGTRGAHIGRRNRLPAFLRRTPENQTIVLRRRRHVLRRGCHSVIYIHCMSANVLAGRNDRRGPCICSIGSSANSETQAQNRAEDTDALENMAH